MRLSRPAVAAGLLVLLASREAGAQASYRPAPIGGRTTLMGGTAMVYGRDAAAGFVNPATAVLVDDQRLSFSVNFYRMQFLAASDWYQPGPIDRKNFGGVAPDHTGAVDMGFDALPSSLCLFFRVGDVFRVFGEKEPRGKRTREARLGVCAATTQGSSLDFAAETYSAQGTTGTTRQAQTVSQSYSRFALGPVYALRIDDQLSVGAAMHGTLAVHRSLFSTSAVTYGGGATPITTTFYNASRGDAFALDAVVGATYKFGARQTLGIALQAPSLHVYGVAGANGNSAYEGAGAASSAFSAKGSFVAHTPMRLSIGTGFEASWGNVAFDASYYTPVTAYRAVLQGNAIRQTGGVIDDQNTTIDVSQRLNGVVNLAVGAEIGLSSSLSMLTGVATDVSGLGKGELKGSTFNYFPDRQNRIAFSHGINSHGEGGEVMFGAEFSYGWGERQAVNSYQLPPALGSTHVDVFTVIFVIAGSTTLHNIRRVVEDVKEVVAPGTKKKEIPPEKKTREEDVKGRRDAAPGVPPAGPTIELPAK